MTAHATPFRRIAALAAATLLTGGLLVAGQIAPASASNTNDMMRMQSENDTTPQDCTASSGWACGGWDQLSGGVNARPYVKRFSVKTNGVETLIIDNTTNSPNPVNIVPSNLNVVIAPTNLCGPGQAPVQNGRPFCYATPNRVSVMVAYQGNDGGHYDLRTPGATTPAVDSTTEYRIQLGLNTIGQNLRWTYMNGTPTYWKVTQIGQPTATLDVRMKAGDAPFVSSGGGCSQIPVNTTCDATTASEMLLSASMILSLDNTLDQMFTGSLFAGTGAYIGSLETIPGTTTGSNPQSPQMTYGIAAPKNVNGSPNAPTFSAFLSEEVILNYFGLPLDTFLPDASLPGVTNTFFDSAFAFTNAGGTKTVNRWTAGGQGTEGMYLKLANIPLATQTVSELGTSELSPSAVAVTNPKYKVKSKPTPTITATRTKVTVTGTLAACNAPATCRIRVLKLGSKFVKTTTDLMAAPKAITLSSSAVAKNYDTAMTGAGRVAVVIESHAAGTTGWKYATSVVRNVA